MFSDIEKLKKIHRQETCYTKTVTRHPSSKRKIIPDGNLDLHKGFYYGIDNTKSKKHDNIAIKAKW